MELPPIFIASNSILSNIHASPGHLCIIQNEKMHRYHSADLDKTHEAFDHLHCYLKKLSSEQESTDDVCVVTLHTQSEIFSDLCSETEWQSFKQMDIEQKFHALPIVGRTLLIEPIVARGGFWWNIFNLKVRALPKLHSIANSRSLAPIQAYRNERWNCIVPSFRFSTDSMSPLEKKSVKQIMGHMVSSMILNTSNIFIPDVMIILSAAMVEYLLRQENVEQWMEKDFQLVEYLVDFYGSEKWRRYQMLCTGTSQIPRNSWIKGLLTDFGNEGIKCEHVKKFVLAWLLKARKKECTALDMKNAYVQCMVEACGRFYASLPSISRSRPFYLKWMSMESFHSEVIMPKIDHFEIARQSYHRREFYDKFKVEAMKVVEELSDDYIASVHAVQATPLPQALEAIVRNLCKTFRNLSAIAGIDWASVELTEQERLACIYLGSKWMSSADRNASVHADVVRGATDETLLGMVSDGCLRAKFIKSVIGLIPGEWGAIYETINASYHNVLPCPIPKSYCERIQAETGVDFEVLVDFDKKTRLPRLACAHKKCRFFMKPAKSRLELDLHLQGVEERHISGLHKVASDRRFRRNMEGAMAALRAGTVLLMPKMGEVYLDDLKANLACAIEVGKEISASASIDEYLRGILEEAMGSYSAPACTYEEFKAAVLAAGIGI